jgi:hypothetical protein
VLLQAMRLRRAVPKIPLKSSAPSRLPLHKSHIFPSHSESTLPQMLIPLHFNSRRFRVYKKTGEGVPPLHPKVLQLVTPATPSSRTHTNAYLPRAAAKGKPNHLYRLLHGSLDIRGVGRDTSARSSFFRVSIFVFRVRRPFAASTFQLWAVSCRL